MKTIRIPIIAATIYLLVYTIATYAGVSPFLIFAMFAFSPVVVVWMAYRIIRYGTYAGKELTDEWGYEDFEP